MNITGQADNKRENSIILPNGSRRGVNYNCRRQETRLAFSLKNIIRAQKAKGSGGGGSGLKTVSLKQAEKLKFIFPAAILQFGSV